MRPGRSCGGAGTSAGPEQRCAGGPTRSWPSAAAGAGTPAGRWERVPRAYRKCHSFSDFWKAYVAVLPEETHRSVGQGDRGDRAHEALVQNPVPAHCALRPRDPLLLQEKLVARDRVDPLVHRRVQPLMLRVARIGA